MKLSLKITGVFLMSFFFMGHLPALYLKFKDSGLFPFSLYLSVNERGSVYITQHKPNATNFDIEIMPGGIAYNVKHKGANLTVDKNGCFFMMGEQQIMPNRFSCWHIDQKNLSNPTLQAFVFASHGVDILAELMGEE